MAAPAPTVFTQGLAAVTGDNLNTFVQGCVNYAQLRSFIGLSGMQALVQGAVSPGDGGQGIFYWNSSIVTTDNNSTIIVPTGLSQGAWLRSGYLSTLDFSYQYVAPVNGFNITIGPGVGTLILNAASALASGTIRLPSSPIDGQVVVIASSTVITAVTLASSQTISTPITTLAAGGSAAYQYVLSNATWFRTR